MLKIEMAQNQTEKKPKKLLKHLKYNSFYYMFYHIATSWVPWNSNEQEKLKFACIMY